MYSCRWYAQDGVQCPPVMGKHCVIMAVLGNRSRHISSNCTHTRNRTVCRGHRTLSQRERQGGRKGGREGGREAGRQAVGVGIHVHIYLLLSG